MKVSAQEEYGLRCMVRLARRQMNGSSHPLSLAEIARDEGLTVPNVAKMIRRLRRAGLVRSVLGRTGGYTLSRDAAGISIAEILGALGDRLFDSNHCAKFAGDQGVCAHDVDCSIRSLWGVLESLVGKVLDQTMLSELLGGEQRMITMLDGRTPPAVQLNPGCR
jgi:Rrf2 family protein